MTLCSISDCSVRLNQGLLLLYSTNVNSGYVALWVCGAVVLWCCGTVALWYCGAVVLWRVTQKVILPLGLFLKGIICVREGQGRRHSVNGEITNTLNHITKLQHIN